MRNKINEEIKKKFADDLFKKLNEACDLLEYYDNNEEVYEFLRGAIKLFNSMYNIQDNIDLLKEKLERVKKETNEKIKGE